MKGWNKRILIQITDAGVGRAGFHPKERDVEKGTRAEAPVGCAPVGRVSIGSASGNWQQVSCLLSVALSSGPHLGREVAGCWQVGSAWLVILGRSNHLRRPS